MNQGRFHEKKLLVFFYFSCASCPNWGEAGGYLDKIQKRSSFFFVKPSLSDLVTLLTISDNCETWIMTFRVSDLQSDSDLDSIRNSCDVSIVKLDFNMCLFSCILLGSNETTEVISTICFVRFNSFRIKNYLSRAIFTGSPVILCGSKFRISAHFGGFSTISWLLIQPYHQILNEDR